MLIEEETARAASEAANRGQKADPPTANTGAVPPADPNVDLGEDGKPLPFDQHPKWKAARSAEKLLQGLMSANGVDTPEELTELLTSGKAIAGRVNPDDLDAIIEKANTLTQYEKVWAAQEESRKRAGESLEETTYRLSKEKEDLQRKLEQRDSADDTKKMVDGYNSTVVSVVKAALPDLPPEEHAFLVEFLGVGNPAVEVDITNKAAVAKMARDQIKKFEKYGQFKIKQYLEGKSGIVDVPRSGSDTGSTQPRATLTTARAALHARWKPFG